MVPTWVYAVQIAVNVVAIATICVVYIYQRRSERRFHSDLQRHLRELRGLTADPALTSLTKDAARGATFTRLGPPPAIPPQRPWDEPGEES